MKCHDSSSAHLEHELCDVKRELVGERAVAGSNRVLVAALVRALVCERRIVTLDILRRRFLALCAAAAAPKVDDRRDCKEDLHEVIHCVRRERDGGE